MGIRGESPGSKSPSRQLTEEVLYSGADDAVGGILRWAVAVAANNNDGRPCCFAHKETSG